MSERGFRLRADGFTSIPKGVDGGRSPSDIGVDQVTFAYNATFRGGHPKQRPPLVYRARLPTVTGSFQGCDGYVHDNGKNHLISFVGGKTYRTWISDWLTEEITITNDPNPVGLSYVWSVQAENFQVWQDNFSVPLIYNGSVLKRATIEQIKTGSVMAYSKGRIWYCAADGFSFRATDIVKGPSGTPSLRYRDAMLFEKDNSYLNTVAGFSVPSTSAGIKAMVVPATLDASMGQGPLQVFTPSTVFSVDAPVDKATWQNVQYPIVTTSQINYGALGARNAITVNGDIFYRAQDGIRSFIVAQRSFGTWGNLPISREVRNILEYDQPNLLPFGSAVFFDNRLIMTCWPFYTRQGICHKGLVILNFDEVGTMLDKGPPAWEGVWTGLQTLQVVKTMFRGVERCFLFVVNATDNIEIWELMKEGFFDEYGTQKNRIVWSFGTPAYSWQNRFSRKKLTTAQIFVKGIQGRVDFDVQWQPDQFPCPIPWHQWSECNTVEQCNLAGTCPELKNLKPGYRTKIRLPQPPDTCDVNIGMPFREFFESQFVFTVTGPATILQARFITQDLDEVLAVECPIDEACKELNACCSPFDYHSDANTYPPGYPEANPEQGTPGEEWGEPIPEGDDAPDETNEPSGSDAGEPTTNTPDQPDGGGEDDTPVVPPSEPLTTDDFPSGTPLPDASPINPVLQLFSSEAGAAFILLPRSAESGFLFWYDLPLPWRQYAMSVLAPEIDAVVQQKVADGYTYVGFLTPEWSYNSQMNPGNLRDLGAEADGAGVPHYTFGTYGWSVKAVLQFQKLGIDVYQPTPVVI